MKLYQISGPTIARPTYAIGLAVARLVAKTHTGAQKPEIVEAQHPHPPSAVSVGDRRYRIWFVPGTETMVLAALQAARRAEGFVCISSQQDDLYCSSSLLELFKHKLEQLVRP